MMDPILIDECLSPGLASVAQARGLAAMHVTWLNMEGASDWAVAGVAKERNYVVVTRIIAATFFASMRNWRFTTG